MTTLSDSIRRYRLTLLLTAVTILAITALATSTSAWTSEDVNPAEKEYRSAYVYTLASEYYRGEYVNPSYTSIPIQSGYGGYMSYPVSHLDDRIHIESASISIIARNSGSVILNVKVMDREFHQLDPEIALTSIWKATSAGTVSISTGLAYRTYTVSITGAALEDLRDIIAGEDDYLVIAFDLSSLGWVDLFPRYIDLSGTHYSTLTLDYDDEAPDVPDPDVMAAFSAGDRVPVSWSSVTDNPSGGSRGEVTYQVGVYLPEAPANNPYYTSTWVDVTHWNLTRVADGVAYTFRVRARDGSGFESNWSDPVNTTVDNSPPSVPTIAPMSPYFFGTVVTIHWMTSIDAGVGDVSYQVQKSPYRRFGADAKNNYTTEWIIDYFDVPSNITFFYRVRARDGFGHWSDWSPIESSIQDSQPPTVPVPIDLPTFTPGTSNVFRWHPAHDGGIGVERYFVQVATTPDFAPGSIVSKLDLNTRDTYLLITNLSDGIAYYYRVRAVDALGYRSEWSTTVSSTQDGSGPSAPFLHSLPEYMSEGSVTLTWAPAVDHGVGVSHYEVWWYMQGPPGSSPMVYSIEVLGQSLTLPELGPGEWNFGLMAVDRFDQSGPGSSVNTTVDATPPTAPVLVPLPEFSKGTSVTLEWSSSTDDSGVDHYRVSWMRSNNNGSIRQVDVPSDTEATIVDLAEGVLHRYQVTAYDLVGNFASSSWVSSTQDASPPRAPYLHALPEFIDRDPVYLAWQGGHDAGVGMVEYRLYWDVVWGDAKPDVDTSGDSGWIGETSYEVEDLDSGRKYWFEVRARDALGHLSNSSATVITTIDRLQPVVTIDSPIDNDSLARVVSVECSVEERNLERVTLFYKTREHGSWVRVADRVDAGVDEFSFPWITSTVPDGPCWLKVSAIDQVGHEGSAEVRVSVMNGRLLVDPVEFSLSDPRPVDGSNVTLMIPVHNTGDTAISSVIVDIYEGDRLVVSLWIDQIAARSFEVVDHQFLVRDRVVLNARAYTDLHDSGDFLGGYRVRTVKETNVEEGSETGLYLGALALVISLVALLLALSSRRKAPARDMGEWEESGH